MKLYGTTTSPFVRRVRVVAAEVGAPYELVNTAPDEGQAALRAVSPIWKVPVAELGERIIYDSRIIIEWLTTFCGWGEMRPPSDRWREANLVNAIDGAARLMRAPLAGGEEELVLERVRPFLWSVMDTRIVFVIRGLRCD